MKRILPFVFGLALSFGFGWVAMKPLFSGVVLGVTTEVRATAAKTFAITARQWEFDPATITVDEGDTITFNITSEDVTHGFSLPEFDVSKTLSPGTTTTATFTADEAGTFSFSCSVSCGTGHGGMRGTLIVNESEDETAPSVPTGLTATAVSSTEIALSWTASTDAVGVTGYNIYRNGTKIGTSTATTYSDSAAKASTRYTYTVAAFDAESNASAQSGTVATTTPVPPDTTPPVISGVSVSSVTSTSAAVTWATDEPAKGRIEYGTVTKSYPMKTADEKAELTSHGLQMTGLTASTTYFLRVMNADESGNAGYSSEVSFATTAGTTNANSNTSSANTATTNSATTTTSEGTTNVTANTNGSISPSVGTATGVAEPGIAIAVPAPTLDRVATPTASVTIDAPVPEAVTGTATEAGSSTASTATTFQASVGEPLTFEGTTTPNTDVTITIQSDPIIRTTRSDSEGKWSYVFRETDLLEPGDHTVTVAVKDETKQTSVVSDPVAFRILPVEAQTTSSEEVKSSGGSWEVWGIVAVFAALVVILVPLIIKYRKG